MTNRTNQNRKKKKPHICVTASALAVYNRIQAIASRVASTARAFSLRVRHIAITVCERTTMARARLWSSTSSAHKKRARVAATVKRHGIIVTSALLFIANLLFPQFTHSVVAAGPRYNMNLSEAMVFMRMHAQAASLVMPEKHVQFAAAGADSVPAKPSVAWSRYVLITAYSSTPDQTDSTPFIGAKGTFVRDGVVAANWLRFNTKVRIPEYYGDKEFVVEDRMHTRFSDRMDIWMPTRAEAQQWGARWVKVEVLQ